MKIAYIIYPFVIYSNKSNGIRSQAVTWANMLVAHGHQVDLINNWSDYVWNNYDAIHFFGPGGWSAGLMEAINSLNKHIFYSPIIDPFHFNRKKEKFKLKLAVKSKFKYHTPFCEEMQPLKVSNHILVRSQFEKQYIQEMYDIEDERITIIPLSISTFIENATLFPHKREDFVLHISSIYQPRKYVIRLIQAANKYHFKLVLAGNPGTKEDLNRFKKEIGNNSIIQIIGFISEEKKLELYSKAKVFALPSICEGVRIVAVDAAYCGCDTVITNDGGPKEYHNKLAIEVSPYSIDEIGIACNTFLKGETFQPALSEYIKNNYSTEKILQLLEKTYTQF